MPPRPLASSSPVAPSWNLLRETRAWGWPSSPSAVGLEDVALVLAHLVGTDEDALVSTALGDEGQPHARVSRSRFHDGATGLELARGLGGINHPNRDAVLDRTTGVDVLHLDQHGAGNPVRDRVELDQGCVPDEVGDILGILHPVMLSDSEQIPGQPLPPAGSGTKACAVPLAYGGTATSIAGTCHGSTRTKAEGHG